MDRRVGVLMGGPSCERDISLKSGNAVLRALKNRGIDSVPVELPKASTMNGYREKAIKKILSSKIDAAFIALHGRFGEDGEAQKILEDIKISYTGSRVEASRCGMDKIVSKAIFKSDNLPIPEYRLIGQGEAPDNIGLDMRCTPHVYFKELGSPLVVKPSNEGSSIGLSIVDSDGAFVSAIKNAFKYSDKVIIEEYISGREITVGILEDRPLPIVEIIPKNKFFDFEAKYEKGVTEYRVPAEIGEAAYGAAQNIALSAHRALGALYFSRVDMILSDRGDPVVLEVNTIPGLTETSLLPKAALAAGIDFEGLVLKILEPILW